MKRKAESVKFRNGGRELWLCAYLDAAAQVLPAFRRELRELRYEKEDRVKRDEHLAAITKAIEERWPEYWTDLRSAERGAVYVLDEIHRLGESYKATAECLRIDLAQARSDLAKCAEERKALLAAAQSAAAVAEMITKRSLGEK